MIWRVTEHMMGSFCQLMTLVVVGLALADAMLVVHYCGWADGLAWQVTVARIH